jgi:hypothetical protein
MVRILFVFVSAWLAFFGSIQMLYGADIPEQELSPLQSMASELIETASKNYLETHPHEPRFELSSLQRDLEMKMESKTDQLEMGKALHFAILKKAAEKEKEISLRPSRLAFFQKYLIGNDYMPGLPRI